AIENENATVEWFTVDDNRNKVIIGTGFQFQLEEKHFDGLVAHFFFGATKTCPNGVVVVDPNSYSSITFVKASLPTLSASTPACNPDRTSYSFTVTTNASSLTGDHASATLTNNNDGTWTVSVPDLNNINLTAKSAQNCENTLAVTAPSCPCPTIEVPKVSVTSYQYCENQTAPAIAVDADYNPNDIVFKWYDNTDTLINTGKTLALPNGVVSGTFAVKAYNTVSNCYSQAVQVTLTQNSLPELTVVGSQRIEYCSSQPLPSIQIQSNADEIKWYFEGRLIEFQGQIYQNAQPGNYSIRAYSHYSNSGNQNVCENQIDVQVIQNNAPTITSNGDQNYCIGNPIPTLSVNAVNYNQINWFDEPTMTNQVNSGLTFDNAKPGTYYVQAVNNSTLCKSEIIQVSLNQVNIPQINIASNYQYLFYGQTLQLYSNADNDSLEAITWNGPNNFSSHEYDPTVLINRPEQQGNYSLSVVGQNEDCTNHDQIYIFTLPNVQDTLPDHVYLCHDETTALEYPQHNNFIYSWNGPNGFSSNNHSIEVTQEGTYSLTVTAPDGNQSIGSVNVQKSDLALQEVSSCFNQVIVTPTGGKKPYEFSIDGINWQASPIFLNVNNGYYQVKVRDANQCSVSSSKQYIKNLNIFQTFSPNGDNINDNWDLSNLQGCPNIKVSVFDRYGRIIHNMNRNNLIWNGRVDGKPVPSNTYWFAIDFKDNVTPTIKSHITLKEKMNSN
ncbi:MAG: T9SS type B sorting domain-containing protein, partial [Flavobacteriales bacterium]